MPRLRRPGDLTPPGGAVPLITQFRGQYRFLSNFWPAQIVWRWRTWPTVEHAYQASKFDDPAIVEAIWAAAGPGGAKALGRRYAPKVRSRTIEERLVVMEELLRLKFADPALAQQLAWTLPRALIEGNTWGDKFWGVDARTGEGENYLGRLLMKIRDELRATVAKGPGTVPGAGPEDGWSQP